MFLSKRFILNYYRFSRGLKAAQGLWRRHVCMRAYVIDIFYYRMAKRIQRLFRGHYCRVNMFQQRIIDIHHASSLNNYDRLKHYIDKYPELIIQLDPEGNTALHNAAKTASKRTLKLLLRFKMNPNALNVSGYSALHLCIMSPAVNRDDCFEYMLEHGFDIDQLCPDGKSCLLLAAHYNRSGIVHTLLEEGLDANATDYSGLTCLQTACTQGNYTMVQELIQNEADVNSIGQNGTYPLHDCVLGGVLEIAHLLFHHGAYINVVENAYGQSPLMWACQQQGAQSEDIVRLYILQGAKVNARDYMERTAAHYAATSDSVGIYNALREADCDFDAIDSQGDTPLHLAAESGASHYATSLLYGGVYCSGQNSAGNQPAHIAAKYNQLELLRHISLYDEHIGRVNFAHQTPLGVAKFHESHACREFLETNYRLVETRDTRNVLTGELYWDRAIDDLAGDWDVHVNAQAERIYVHKRTGEVRNLPPPASLDLITQTAQTAELPLKRNIVLVKEENKLNKHAYYIEYAQKELDVAELSKEYNNATIINKFARRKCAYLLLIRLRTERRHQRTMRIFMKQHLPNWKRWRKQMRDKKITQFQRIVRGYLCRKKYFAPVTVAEDGTVTAGHFETQRRTLAHRRLRYNLWDLWCAYKFSQDMKQLLMAKHLPETLAEWQDVILHAGRALRSVGMYEEYLYPNTRSVLFYRHMTTGSCYMTKPAKMAYLDEEKDQEKKQIKKYGATLKQIKVATKFQSLYRGYKVRTYSKVVERAMNISLYAEQKYLQNPEADNNLYNYGLCCLTQSQDLDRARRVYVEALRRMQYRGPDIPFVLYSYAIFAMVSQDEDYFDITVIVERAKRAEEQREVLIRQRAGEGPPKSIAEGTFQHGKVFELAKTGFFRHSAVQNRNAFGYEALAVCHFLVYSDFNNSFDAFMEAFKYDPLNKKLQANFDIMMTHFHGKDKRKHDEVVKTRLRYHSQLAADREELRRLHAERVKNRNIAAKKIQKFYANRKGLRVFNAFMASVRNSLSSKQQRQGNAGGGSAAKRGNIGGR